MSKDKKLKVAGLFSGCGGLDLGFIQAGYEVVWANDFNPDAVVTYKKNIGILYELREYLVPWSLDEFASNY
jgi:DNA (cytosine-5)-methyltransferase 1